ncbi:alpha-glucosidase/alpha-galactosidase [uncultured Cohaesibacter sp.]|uniref:family 4 glycosyl hydrolase n=1 Tax=uncultured Cohaesibacter sp. TaxID=1002546 RepID=UPI0029C73BE2|nr:alpha-glucosidase/alpha-galactosidase [uncultured Cohaesibacter sp.]
MKKVKITYIGGGSQQWALRLMSDLALSDKLTGSLVLYDIDHGAALKNQEISSQIFGKPGALSKFDVEVEDELDNALKGADFVVISIEPGPTQKRFIDLKIPEKYGVYQSVGDTTGPGGIARALRSIPTMADFAHHIMAVCPDAWVINYTNPMAWCTGALYAAEPEIKALGCCHEVFHTQEMLAKWIAQTYGVETPSRKDIKLDISGVNHFTFATDAVWKGKSILAEFAAAMQEGDPAELSKIALGRESREEWFTSEFKIAENFLTRFGVLGAAGDRHLAEFVPWYLISKEEINSWGVCMTPYEWRIKRASNPDEARQKYLQGNLAPSGEEGVLLLEALAGATEEMVRTNFNMPNMGQNPDAPVGAIVESYGLISENKVEPIGCGILPEAVQALEDRNIEIQQLVLEGVMNRDKDMVFAGFAIDPLNNISPRAAKAMFDEIWEALELDW